MRGIHSVVDDLRNRVFEEVARLSYEGGDLKRIDKIPYKIIPGEVAKYRSNVFLERAIITERLRLACGLPARSAAEYNLPSEGIEDANIPEKYYEPPLINVVKFACNACPESEIRVSSNCQGCLSHPCQAVCPRDAIVIVNGRSTIDQGKCIKCGKCLNQCPYDAISRIERPCAKACGMDAIKSDEMGRAEIDVDKCVSCGMCLVNCPFGAIVDKSQIFQLIQAIKSGDEVVACVAPAFVNQFGKDTSTAQLRKAMRILGFSDTVEVAIGADLCTIEEAHDFMEKVPEKLDFMATSCCPAWRMMAEKLFPEFKENISSALTPMVITARLIKKSKPNAKIVFIGPCAAKKLEAMREDIRSDVDFVLTFEELQGMFKAKDIDFATLVPDECDKDFDEATGSGRGFAVVGGVAAAVTEYVAKIAPELNIKTEYANGLKECRKMLLMAKVGKRNGYLLEGMACPGGCVAGAGTIAPVPAATAGVAKYKNDAAKKLADESSYASQGHEVSE